MNGKIVKRFAIIFTCLICLFLLTNCHKNDLPSDKKDQITITFVVGEAAAAADPTQVIKKGETFTIGDNFTKQGYRLMGWYLDEQRQVPYVSSMTFQGDTKLYAKWEKLYCITYHLNGGMGLTETVQYGIAGETITLPRADGLSKGDMLLTGWLDGTTSYLPGQQYTMRNQDVQLSAVWGDSCHISFSLAGGSGTIPEPMNVLAGTEITLPSADQFRKPNYTFGGWSDGQQIYSPSAKVIVTNSINFTAVWDGNYQITYDLNDGSSPNVVEEHAYGSIISLMNPTPRTGYTFVGWLVDAAEFSAKDDFVVPNHDVVFVAQWVKMTYFVSFYDWDGTLLGRQEVPYQGSAVAPNHSVIQVTEFIGWSADFDCITENTVVRAQYDYQPTDKSLFQFIEVDQGYAIAAAYEVQISGDVVFPHSYKGKRVIGVADGLSLRMGAFYNQPITSITLPSTFEYIGMYAFRDCRNLKRVVLPENAAFLAIKEDAFMECNVLNDIQIPNTMTAIGERAFYGTAIARINLPASLENLGLNVFFGCQNLTEILVNVDNPFYCSIDNNLYSKDQTKLIRYAIGKMDTAFVIPAFVQTVADYAFSRAEHLVSITFDKASVVRAIGNYAFANATHVTTLEIPNTVTSFGQSAFYAITADITLFEGMTEIQDGVFTSYGGKSLRIPASVTRIGEGAFIGSTIEQIIFSDDSQLETIAKQAFYQCSKLVKIDFADLLHLKTIAEKAFFQTKLDVIHFPASLETIGESAFEKSQINMVYFNENSQLSLLADSAFFECKQLMRVQFADNSANTALETVFGNYVFTECISLVDVVLPESLVAIGGLAFGSYAGFVIPISKIVLPKKVRKIEESAFNGCQLMKSFTIQGNSLQYIGAYAFKLCESLTSLRLPAAVSEIGIGFIQYCDSLNELIVDANNPNYEVYKGGIYDIRSQTLITGIVPDSGAVEVKPGTKMIAEAAYKYNLKIDTLYIPQSLQVIGVEAFKECLHLIVIDIAKNSALENIRDGAFSSSVLETFDSMNLQSIELPEGLQYIGVDAFNGNTHLEGIVIPASVKEIGGYAFNKCYSLTSVTTAVNSQLETIGAYAFGYCEKITEVQIMSRVLTLIKAGAFYKNTQLVRLEIHSPKTVLGNSVFKYTSENLKIYVPADSLNYYKNADGWSAFTNKIFAI